MPNPVSSHAQKYPYSRSKDHINCQAVDIYGATALVAGARDVGSVGYDGGWVFGTSKRKTTTLTPTTTSSVISEMSSKTTRSCKNFF